MLVCSLDFLSAGAGKTGTITIGATIAQPGEHVLRPRRCASASGDRNAADNTIVLRVNTPAVVAPQPPEPAAPTAPAGKTTDRHERQPTSSAAAPGRMCSTVAAATTRSTAAPATTGFFGGTGNDRLVGGLGRDILQGGPGNDRLESRDGVRDQLSCGLGKRDVVDRRPQGRRRARLRTRHATLTAP